MKKFLIIAVLIFTALSTQAQNIEVAKATHAYIGLESLGFLSYGSPTIPVPEIPAGLDMLDTSKYDLNIMIAPDRIMLKMINKISGKVEVSEEYEITQDLGITEVKDGIKVQVLTAKMTSSTDALNKERFIYIARNNNGVLQQIRIEESHVNIFKFI